jgi:spoIIIJ-associated protein
MTEEQVFEGKDLAEALDHAAQELGVPEAELHYEILEQGRRGLLGLGVKSVRIRVMQPLDAELPSQTDQPGPEPAQKSPKPAQPKVVTETSREVEKTLQRMIELMGLDLKVEASAQDDGVSLQLQGPDQKMLTSRNAELLSAIQFLLTRMSRRTWPDAGRIHVSCNGQTRRRDDELVELAKRVADQVSSTGKTKKLQPMNAYERRLIHITVREFAGLTSSSDGSGALKRVRISKVQNVI